MLYIILNNTIHRSRNKIEIKKKRLERQKYKYFNVSCVTFFLHLKSMQLVNISVQKVYCWFSVQPCHLWKYSNRSMRILYTTVWLILIVTIYLFCRSNKVQSKITRLFICAFWSPAGKGLTSWPSFVVSSVSLSLSHWYPRSGVVLDCIDSWSLHHYLLIKCKTYLSINLFPPPSHIRYAINCLPVCLYVCLLPNFEGVLGCLFYHRTSMWKPKVKIQYTKV